MFLRQRRQAGMTDDPCANPAAAVTAAAPPPSRPLYLCVQRLGRQAHAVASPPGLGGRRRRRTAASCSQPCPLAARAAQVPAARRPAPPPPPDTRTAVPPDASVTDRPPARPCHVVRPRRHRGVPPSRPLPASVESDGSMPLPMADAAPVSVLAVAARGAATRRVRGRPCRAQRHHHSPHPGPAPTTHQPATTSHPLPNRPNAAAMAPSRVTQHRAGG